MPHLLAPRLSCSGSTPRWRAGAVRIMLWMLLMLMLNFQHDIHHKLMGTPPAAPASLPHPPPGGAQEPSRSCSAEKTS